MIFFLLADFCLHGCEGSIEGTMEVPVWCAKGTETLNIVRFIMNCADTVNHRINHVDDEDLRVSGNK